MNTPRRFIAKAAFSILSAIPMMVSAGAALTQTFSDRPASLRQRVVWPKPTRTVLNPAKSKADAVVVKFREGTHIRERAGQLEADLLNLSEAEELLLQRAALPRQRVFQELAQVNSLIFPNTKRFVRRLFTTPENELDADKRTGEARSGEELADLNLYYLILTGDAKTEETERLINQLNALDIVEIAYPQPLMAAAAKIDLSGARRNGIEAINIEAGRNIAREDASEPLQFEDAVNRTARALAVGDIIVIGQHARGPDSGLNARCNIDQFESVPMEFWDADFDAIKHATAKGIVVIEDAGNGSMNLDSPFFGRKFDLAVRDSGAILVGGGLSSVNAPECFANFGSRIELQGWSENAAGHVAESVAFVQNLRKARNLTPFTSVAIRNFFRQADVGEMVRTTTNLRANPEGDGGGNPSPNPTPTDCVTQARKTFTATPSTVDLVNNETLLQWSVQFPKTCSPDLGPVLLGGEPVSLVGSKVVHPMATTAFSLTIPSGGGAVRLASTNVTVNLPEVVDIKGSTQEWARLMIQALKIPGETVRLAPNVDLDLSGENHILISEGVSLLGGEPCPVVGKGGAAPAGGLVRLCGGHDAQHTGPRLYTHTRPQNLFVISCDVGNTGDNVRLSGFRLQGPHWDSEEGDDNLERGIYIESCLGVDIGSMELSGWSGASISITDQNLGRQNDPQAVRIHDNFIHHNQHIGGFGYGVDIGPGAYALIERNVFDFNRHAITANGRPDTGYTAYQNLVLKGGGVHGRFYNEHTHEFDVHGDQDCLAPANCGNAGESIWMVNNAFQYVRDSAIKIRGTPSYGVFVNQNAFAHEYMGGADDSIYDEAVKYNGSPERLHIGEGDQANILNTDTYGQYGVCDFDGDGKDDLFLATGVTWWYMNGAKRQWVFLNSYPERLNQVGLGDFDGDHRCDVFAVHGNDWLLSSGGTAPWRSLGSFGVPFDQLRFGDFNGDGIKDMFRRAPDGQWLLISPGIYGPTPVQSSDSPLSDLRFGDFNNNGITDVIAIKNGRWSVSWDARTSWQPLNPSLSNSLASVLIVDLDANGKDEILRWVPTSDISGRWEVSWDGRTDWKLLSSISWSIGEQTELPAYKLRAYVGRFGDAAGGDLLTLDWTRFGKLFNKTTGAFGAHSMYAY